MGTDWETQDDLKTRLCMAPEGNFARWQFTFQRVSSVMCVEEVHLNGRERNNLSNNPSNNCTNFEPN